MARTLQFLVENARWLGAGALLMAMSSFGQTFFISIFAGQIQAKFDLSHGEWGSIYALGTTASAIVMIWAGVLTDHYRARTLGFICLFGLAASCLFMAVNAWVALLPVVIFCLRLTGQGMSAHIAVVAMARWFVATRGRALATASLGYSVSEMVMPFIFVFLMTLMDWHWLWVLAACISILAAFALKGLLRQERVPGGVNADNTATGMDGKHWTRVEAIRHPLFWFMVPAILGLPAFGTAVLFHQVHYAAIKDVSHLTFVSLLPIYSAVVMVMMVISGIALDRFGTVRLIPFFMLPVCVAFLLFSAAGTIWAMALAFVFFGMTNGAYSTLSNALWAEVYGTGHIGAIKSLTAAVMVLGSALGPAVTGILIDFGFELDRQYAFVAIYFLAASLSIWLGVRHVRPSLSAAV